MHFLIHFLGLDNASGQAYLFWSGIGSDLEELALVGALLGVYRKHQCEARRCWRIGRHTTAANHVVCHRHAPGGAPSHAEILAAHAERVGEEPPNGG